MFVFPIAGQPIATTWAVEVPVLNINTDLDGNIVVAHFWRCSTTNLLCPENPANQLFSTPFPWLLESYLMLNKNQNGSKKWVLLLRVFVCVHIIIILLSNNWWFASFEDVLVFYILSWPFVECLLMKRSIKFYDYFSLTWWEIVQCEK